MSNDANRNPRWRPCQFGLRMLVVVMLCVACFFGGWKVSDWFRERELTRAAALEKQIRTDFFKSIHSGQIPTEWPTDDPPQTVEIIGDTVRIRGAKSLP